MGNLSLLQGVFLTQGSNPGLLHCRWIFYQLSHKGSLRILEWVAILSPGDLPNKGIELGSPALQADSLPTELSGKPFINKGHHQYYATKIYQSFLKGIFLQNFFFLVIHKLCNKYYILLSIYFAPDTLSSDYHSYLF